MCDRSGEQNEEAGRAAGLAAYYSRFGQAAACLALHPRYEDCGIAAKRTRAFAEAVGARVELKIEKATCRENPQWDYLRSVGGDRNTSPSDRDWHIPKLAEFLKSPSIELSRLIWQTIMSIPSGSDYFQAAYWRNYSGGTHYADSRLLHELRAAEWAPQSDGAFVRPAVASSELLPKGFPFDSGYAALKALNFGTDAVRSLERARQNDDVARLAGFKDASALARAKRFAELPAEEQEKFFVERERAAKAAMPDRRRSTTC